MTVLESGYVQLAVWFPKKQCVKIKDNFCHSSDPDPKRYVAPTRHVRFRKMNIGTEQWSRPASTALPGSSRAHLCVTLITALPAREYRVEQTRTLKHCRGYQSLLLPTISTRCFNSLLIIAAVIRRAVNTARDLPPRACNNGLRHHKTRATGNKHLLFVLLFSLWFYGFLFMSFFHFVFLLHIIFHFHSFVVFLLIFVIIVSLFPLWVKSFLSSFILFNSLYMSFVPNAQPFLVTRVRW
jgi:hypothetical protein